MADEKRWWQPFESHATEIGRRYAEEDELSELTFALEAKSWMN